ncbi:hypothetical protein ACETAC_03095 [Aceticella autotrophica]|uniref:DUF6922 domain-containing protein n=1 Tax=Aceticella autotrophica TaxID=2755338 RepID=A0A975AWR8_9THEO|nr:hypothetical protein [Aceticella autotrophica]QSZ27887.1 hypothetical protein ACETAC_03095 [Aceticella autotrophica]
MKLPEDFKPLFKNYDFNSLDTEKHKGRIIKTMLTFGELEQIAWLFEYYGFNGVREVFLNDFYGARELFEAIISLWGLLFLDEKEYRKYKDDLRNMTPAERWKQRRIPSLQQDKLQCRSSII